MLLLPPLLPPLQDFSLLLPLAAAVARLPSLSGLSLRQTLEQFSASMTAQVDMRVEAAHLRRFYANFAGVGAGKVRARMPLLACPGHREGICHLPTSMSL